MIFLTRLGTVRTKKQEEACRALSDRTLVVLHVPKAAGATLRRILFRAYGREACFWIRPSGEERRATMRELKTMSPAEKQKLRVVTGHFHHGTLRGVLPQPKLRVTLLRNPADRVRSQYQYVRQLPGHPHYEIAQDGFESYYSASSPALDNLQTRLLAGGLRADNSQPLDRPVEASDFERALKHLRIYAGVGVQERFNGMVDAMGRLLRWGDLPEVEDAHVEEEPLELDPETRARVTERNRFDAALHREAMARQDWLEDLATRVTGAPGVGNSVVSG